jgi:hypothetical protein
MARDEVNGVYRVAKKSATKSTLIGTAIGAGSGATVASATGCGGQQFCILRSSDLAAVGAVVGAGFGALTGFLFGKLKPKRVLIYDARK